MRFREVGLALCAVLSLWAAGARAACKIEQLAELPVTIEGAPLVQVKINGQDESFAVRSGLFSSSVSETVAKRLGLHIADSDVEATSGNARVKLGITEIRKFELSGIPIAHARLIVSDFYGGEAGGKAAGELGEDILGIADVDYDLPHSVIRLIRPTDCAHDGLAYWAKGGAAELTLTHSSQTDVQLLDRRIEVRGSINDKPVLIVFSTTEPRSVLDMNAATRLGVATPGLAAGPNSSQVGKFETFKIGEETIQNSKITVTAFAGLGADVILGLDFLLSHHVYIANSQGKVYLTYSGGPVFKLEDPPAKDNLAAGLADSSNPRDVLTTSDDFFRRGSAENTRRQFPAAIADFDKAIALDPSNAEAYFERASAQASQSRYDLALGDLNQALRLQPENFRALTSRGQLYARAKDYEKARQDLEAAAKLQSPDDRAVLQLGGLYEGASMYDDAIQQFDKWLKIHPSGNLSASALNGRCWARAVIGVDLNRAVTDCSAALQLAPHSSAIHDSRGLAYLKRGDLDKAIADYNAALTLQPNLSLSLYGRGVAKQRKGLKDAGDADIKAAAALNPGIAEVAKLDGLAP